MKKGIIYAIMALILINIAFAGMVTNNIGQGSTEWTYEIIEQDEIGINNVRMEYNEITGERTFRFTPYEYDTLRTNEANYKWKLTVTYEGQEKEILLEGKRKQDLNTEYTIILPENVKSFVFTIGESSTVVAVNADASLNQGSSGRQIAEGINGELYIAYLSGSNSLYFANSSDNGITWDTQEVDNQDPDRGISLVVQSTGNISIMYAVGGDIDRATSADGGKTWYKVDNEVDPSGLSIYAVACEADSNDVIHCCDTQSSLTTDYINESAGWETNVVQNDPGNNDDFCDISIDGNNHPWVLKSTDWGLQIWSPALRSWGNGNSTTIKSYVGVLQKPKLSIDRTSGNIFTCLPLTTGIEVFNSTITHGGNWTNQTINLDNNASKNCDIFVHKSYVTVITSVTNNGEYAIFKSMSNDTGKTWVSEMIHFDTADDYDNPNILNANYPINEKINYNNQNVRYFYRDSTNSELLYNNFTVQIAPITINVTNTNNTYIGTSQLLTWEGNADSYYVRTYKNGILQYTNNTANKNITLDFSTEYDIEQWYFDIFAEEDGVNYTTSRSHHNTIPTWDLTAFLRNRAGVQIISDVTNLNLASENAVSVVDYVTNIANYIFVGKDTESLNLTIDDNANDYGTKTDRKTIDRFLYNYTIELDANSVILNFNGNTSGIIEDIINGVTVFNGTTVNITSVDYTSGSKVIVEFNNLTGFYTQKYEFINTWSSADNESILLLRNAGVKTYLRVLNNEYAPIDEVQVRIYQANKTNSNIFQLISQLYTSPTGDVYVYTDNETVQMVTLERTGYTPITTIIDFENTENSVTNPITLYMTRSNSIEFDDVWIITPYEYKLGSTEIPFYVRNVEPSDNEDIYYYTTTERQALGLPDKVMTKSNNFVMYGAFAPTTDYSDGYNVSVIIKVPTDTGYTNYNRTINIEAPTENEILPMNEVDGQLGIKGVIYYILLIIICCGIGIVFAQPNIGIWTFIIGLVVLTIMPGMATLFWMPMLTGLAYPLLLVIKKILME